MSNPEERNEREWWVSGWDVSYQPSEGSAWTAFFTHHNPGKPEAFQVVEKSAYDAVVKERDEARANQHPWALLQECDKLRAQLADHKRDSAAHEAVMISENVAPTVHAMNPSDSEIAGERE